MAIRAFNDMNPRLCDGVYVAGEALVVGDVELGADSSVWPGAVLRGDVNSIRVGARTNVQDGSVIHVTHCHALRPNGHATVIGNDVTIGHRAVLHGCAVGNECLVGMGAIVLDGAVLEDRVLLGAGALVTEGKVLESGHLYLGSPARKVRALTEEEFSRFKYAAVQYVSLKDEYLKHLAREQPCIF